MAIPGYLQKYGMSYSESEYYAYVSQLVGTYADSFSEAVTVVEKVRESLPKLQRFD